MKIVYYKENLCIPINKKALNSLVIEDNDFFEQAVIRLYDTLEKKSEDVGLLVDETKSDITKFCELIVSPLELIYNKREIQKKFYAELFAVAEDLELLQLFAEQNGKMIEAIEKLQYETSYDIEFNEEFDFAQILKSYDVNIVKPSGTFATKLTDYMVTIRRLAGKNFFVIANCDAYLKGADYKEIEKIARHYEITVLFLRNRQVELNKDINEYIIDKDLCEIH